LPTKAAQIKVFCSAAQREFLHWPAIGQQTQLKLTVFCSAAQREFLEFATQIDRILFWQAAKILEFANKSS
jgi:hypothetical protein